MYYVNREQIERRLHMLPEIVQVLKETFADRDVADEVLAGYARERALHLALEIVTDVGSFLIDGFIMRDASSYEDIIDIMLDEKVIDQTLHVPLTDLVRQRKPLVQEYFNIDQSGIEKLVGVLLEKNVLESFAAHVRSYLDQEGIEI